MSKNTFSIPASSNPTISINDTLSDINDFSLFLTERGISTHNTRLSRYSQYLKNLTLYGIEKFDPKSIFKNVEDDRFKSSTDWYLYVLREVHELSFILKGLRSHIPIGVDNKLIKIVEGSDFAALDRNTECRNTQFELRIATYFCLSGFSVDMSSETDLVASKEDIAFYIECKRISSKKQLKDNLIKAKTQILNRIPKKISCLEKNIME